MTDPLILKRAPIGDNQEDYDVLEGGMVVGRIFLVPTGPEGRPWMWASGHNGQISPRGSRLRADTRGCDVSLRQELARAALAGRPTLLVRCRFRAQIREGCVPKDWVGVRPRSSLASALQPISISRSPSLCSASRSPCSAAVSPRRRGKSVSLAWRS